MLCPICNGKTKIVQTHTEMEAVIEKCILPQDETAKDFSKYEIKSGHKVVNRPVIRRKHKCKECNCYFWTKEKFDGFTETETRKLAMDQLKKGIENFNDEGCVYCIPPEKIKIKFNRGGDTI